MDKIKVYVCSLRNTSLLEFTDMESARHACSQATDKEIFSGMRKLSAGSWNGVLSENEVEAINLVKEISEKYGFEFEIIDAADCGTMEKLKLMMKRVKAPAIFFRNKIIQGDLTREKLERLLQE